LTLTRSSAFGALANLGYISDIIIIIIIITCSSLQAWNVKYAYK